MKVSFKFLVATILILTFIHFNLLAAVPSQGQLKTANITDVCFSPGGDCDDRIIQFILSSKKNVDVAIYTFTHEGIFKALKKVALKGIKVRVILDKEMSATSNISIEDLKANHIDYRISSVEGIMHHKFTLVDASELQTGSYNYTYSATRKNAENQIYIKDLETVKVFQKEFNELWGQAL